MYKYRFVVGTCLWIHSVFYSVLFKNLENEYSESLLSEWKICKLNIPNMKNPETQNSDFVSTLEMKREKTQKKK